MQLHALATYSDDTTKDVTLTAVWASDDEGVVIVDDKGVAKAIAAAGSATVTATLEDVAGTATITASPAVAVSIQVLPPNAVVPIGTPLQLSAVVTYSDESTSDVTDEATWSSQVIAVADVDTQGLVTAASVSGTTEIRATFESVTATTLISAAPARLVSLTVTPAMPEVVNGYAQQMTATATYFDNSQADVTAFAQWTSSADAVATVTAGGLATAVANSGSTSIIATMGDVQGSTTLGALPAVLESIAIVPIYSVVAFGDTLQVSAIAHYSDGSTHDVTDAADWISVDEEVATVSDTGLAVGVSPSGSTYLRAIYNSVAGFGVFASKDAELRSIAVTPESVTLPDGVTQQYTAEGTYSDGSTEDVSDMVTWSSGETSIATIGAAGLATTVAGTGTTLVSASLQGIEGSAVLSAAPAILRSLDITPKDFAVYSTYSLQLTASGTYSNGEVLDLSSQVTWEATTLSQGVLTDTGLADTAAVATVDDAGLLTAVSATGVFTGTRSATIGASLAGMTTSTTMAYQPVLSQDVMATLVGRTGGVITLSRRGPLGLTFTAAPVPVGAYFAGTSDLVPAGCISGCNPSPLVSGSIALFFRVLGPLTAWDICPNQAPGFDAFPEVRRYKVRGYTAPHMAYIQAASHVRPGRYKLDFWMYSSSELSTLEIATLDLTIY